LDTWRGVMNIMNDKLRYRRSRCELCYCNVGECMCE